MNLFLDTSNNKLILILEKDDLIIDSFFLDNQNKISDICLTELEKFLKKNNLEITEIKNFYATKGPGSYTGSRVAITILKTFKTIDQSVNVFIISSLAFQAGNKKALSTLDAKGGKIYFGVYDNLIKIIDDQIIPLDYLDDFRKQFSDFEIIKDYNDIDYNESFLQTKNNFELIKNVEELNPYYIKHFI